MPSVSPLGMACREASTNNVDFGCQRAPFFVSSSSGYSMNVWLIPKIFLGATPPYDRAYYPRWLRTDLRILAIFRNTRIKLS